MPEMCQTGRKTHQRGDCSDIRLVGPAAPQCPGPCSPAPAGCRPQGDAGALGAHRGPGEGTAGLLGLGKVPTPEHSASQISHCVTAQCRDVLEVAGCGADLAMERDDFL